MAQLKSKSMGIVLFPSITHANNIGKHFPDIDLSPSRSGRTSKTHDVYINFVVLYYR